MPKIHMILQGKGGSAKTTTAAMIAQFLKDKGKNPICVDTDPVNASFFAYKALNVRRLQIMSDGSIDARAWDSLTEIMGRATQDVVIDNGATSFISLLSYIGESDFGNNCIELCRSMGHEVFVHITITAGEGLSHCLGGMTDIVAQLCSQKPKFVVWLCPFLGMIERDGKQFEDFSEYKECKEYVHSIIKFPRFLPLETFGRDFTYLLSNNITFAEALEMITEQGENGEHIMASAYGLQLAVMSRLRIARDRIYVLLEDSGVF